MENEIEKLIHLFSKLPGLGSRSARRIVLHLLNYRQSLMINLSAQISHTAKSIQICNICANLDVQNPCSICSDPKREEDKLCVVEQVNDLWAIEKSKIFKGRYHILRGTLSAFENRGPEDLNISSLFERLKNNTISEIILATNATLDGQTTAFYLSEKLHPLNIKVSKLAHGMPIGGELDYLDEGTLRAAIESRKFI
jgi:recombination protein RecR